MFSRKYACLNFDSKTNSNLLGYASHFTQSINTSMHCTLIYSMEGNVNTKALPNGDYKLPSFTVNLVPEGLKLFGEENNVLVMTLMKLPGLMKLHEFFKECGCEDKWPSYEPHITLSYEYERNKIPNIFLPSFKINPISFTISDIKEEE